MQPSSPESSFAKDVHYHPFLEDSATEDEIHERPMEELRYRHDNQRHFSPRINDFKLKFDIPVFTRNMHIEEFLDWVKSVETFFDCMDVPVDKQVKLVVCKLRSGAFAWWEQLQAHRHRDGKQPIRSWSRMKQLLKEQFLYVDYDQILYQQYQHCQQKSRIVREYIEEFYRLNARVDLYESGRQQVSRYLGGLKDTIRD